MNLARFEINKSPSSASSLMAKATRKKALPLFGSAFYLIGCFLFSRNSSVASALEGLKVVFGMGTCKASVITS
ncbi:hypothetical protein D3C74_147860 [compost metagenome]